ncbi:Serine protease, partial [Phytophthora megakarya]
PSRRFFELCVKQQGTCPLQLSIDEDEDVLDAVLDIYEEIDTMKNDCAEEWMQLTGIETPSLALRPLLGLLVRDSSTRALVPSILGRMHRCSSKDRQELGLVLGPLLQQMIQNAGGTTALENSKVTTSPKGSLELLENAQLTTSAVSSIDTLEYLLISYSELWAKPSPTEIEIGELYMNGVFSLGFATLSQFCLLSGNLDPTRDDRDPACSHLSQDLDDISGLNISQSFTYDVDELYNNTASVPPNTTLLIINGGLDFQTPWEFGRYQFESTALSDPETSRKMLVEYEFGAHVCGLATTTDDDDTVCGPSIVASFISNNGNPDAIDTSCMSDLPELLLTDDDFSILVERIIEAEREEMLESGFGFERTKLTRTGT